ncbi:MAG TPA: type II toxin-antitoxin system HipA family toxin [Opitutaceae bacterium]|nr:type II toxin-antitoxin system HipA family toxin [Opitutaceae bacterium]
MSTTAIEVRVWGQEVGAIAADPQTSAYAFEYTQAWRRSGVELAPLTMPTIARQDVFTFPGLGESFRRLPGLISDALPDDFGNRLIDAWMAQRGIAKSEVTTLDRLAYTGKRAVGALEFHPARGSQRESAKPIAMQGLVEAARRLVKGDFDGDVHTLAALTNLIRVGTSAGGARAKAVIAWSPTTHEIRSGQFDIAPGFEHWLLKFDGVGKDLELGLGGGYGRIEYAYHLMAAAAGIKMSPCRLLEENDRAHFMTRRFDRDGNQKHHLQSLCALSHLDYRQRATHGYEQLFLAIQQLRLPSDAVDQAYRRMVFNVLARNCDDHTKNFGFILRKGGAWELAPAFDVTHAHNPRGEWTAAHLMGVNGKFDGIGRDDLLAVADRFVVPDAKGAIADVRRALERWPEFAAAAKLSEERIAEIAAEFQKA